MLANGWRNWLLAAFIGLAAAADAGAATKISFVSPQISPAAPGSTDSVLVEIDNPASHGRSFHLLTGVPGYGGIKSRFSVWLPARSRLRWTFPIMLPPVKPQKFSAMPISAAIEGQPHAVRGNQFIQHQRMQTAVVEGARISGVADIAMAMRRQMGLSKMITDMPVGNVPLAAPSLLSIRCMYVGYNKTQLSGTQVQALRDWVLAGGRLWIDLGKSSDRQLAMALLGKKYDLAYVQTIRSAEYSFLVHGQHRVLKLAHSRTLRCYFPGNSRVIVAADHWPMVMRYSLGRGQVWLNALNWRAVVTPQGKAISELWPATRDFLSSGSAPKVSNYALHMAANAIGYRVADRQSVMLVFGVLIALVAVGGWTLSRRGKGGLLGGFALAAALLASGALYALGRMERGPVPQSESAVQTAVIAGNQCFIHGHAAIFAPHQTAVSAHVIAPSLTDWNRLLNSQSNCQFDYSPNQSSITVRHLTIPSGKVVDIAYKTFLHTAAPDLAVHAEVNGNGFAGNLVSKFRIDHAIIAGPSGVMALQLGATHKNQSSFTSGTAQILPAGQYMTGVLLSRNDQRQEALIAAWLAQNPAREPELMAWSSEIPPAWNLTKTQLHICHTLIVIPFSPRLPSPGHRVFIPWTMVRLQIVRGPGGQMSAPVYNIDRHRWIKNMTISGRVYMKYSIPLFLRHIDAMEAHLDFGITAPGRQVSLAVRDGNTWVPVVTVTSGRAVIHQTLQLKPGEFRNGHLLLRLHVGYPRQPGLNWHFAYGRVSVGGRAE